VGLSLSVYYQKILKHKEGVVSALPGPPLQKVVTASAQPSQFDCIAFTFLPCFLFVFLFVMLLVYTDLLFAYHLAGGLACDV